VDNGPTDTAEGAASQQSTALTYWDDDAFFEAWRDAVSIAGPRWFGDGTAEGARRATTKWDLRPRWDEIQAQFGVLSSTEKLFLAVLYGFYNSATSAKLLTSAGFEGFSDLANLDETQRRLVARLVVAFSGW
jgi:hypothetical protein